MFYLHTWHQLNAAWFIKHCQWTSRRRYRRLKNKKTKKIRSHLDFLRSRPRFIVCSCTLRCTRSADPSSSVVSAVTSGNRSRECCYVLPGCSQRRTLLIHLNSCRSEAAAGNEEEAGLFVYLWLGVANTWIVSSRASRLSSGMWSRKQLNVLIELSPRESELMCHSFAALEASGPVGPLARPLRRRRLLITLADRQRRRCPSACQSTELASFW